MNEAQRENLYKLIDEACTNAMVSDLLRDRKTGSGGKFRISGDSKQLLKNLRDAHAASAITDDDLADLLAQGEENGRQHIFLYKILDQAKPRYAKADSVLDALHEALAIANGDLPRFQIEPVDRTTADIRIEKYNGGAEVPTLKTYAGRTVERTEKEKDEQFTKHGVQYIRRIIKVEYHRLVSLVRLHPRGLLEIRIPSNVQDSLKTCKQDLEEHWSLLDPAIREADFIQFDLRKAMKKMVQDQNKRASPFRINAASALDGDATATYSPGTESGDLFASQRHANSIAGYDDFGKLVVFFKPDKDDPSYEIRCQMGIYTPNGIRIGAKCSSAEVDFIVNRLWEYGR